MAEQEPFMQAAYYDINGARLYCEQWGEDHAGQAPVLLIHGSSNTGGEDWGRIAPILARRWRVIIPDCRGHGRSSSTHSYSFAEMAGDLAALLQALGYVRAHVIGHSNGGNVALVMLVEHPQVVQTAVLQAANAYVSADLIEREPAVFDPLRIEREAPEWKASMIRQHAAVHGEAYWRELLQRTLAETISQPNYSAEGLAAVLRPTLAIQGAADPVNAPSRHAQFIAAHIPHAELWVPPGAAHTVHDELPCEWLEVVQSFIERRGDPFNDSLHRLKSDTFRDRRDWIFDLTARISAGAIGQVELSGQVLTQDQLEAAEAAVQHAAANDSPVIVNPQAVQILLTRKTAWALVNRSVTDVYENPTIHSSRLNQGLLGESVRILEESGDWVKVRLERDGYLGWMQTKALYRCDQTAVEDYQAGCTYLVQAELPPAWASIKAAGDASSICGKLAFGTRLAVEHEQGEFAGIRMPDGARWWLRRAALLEQADCPLPDPEGIARTLALMKRFVGTPYLWGGRSPFGYDCSGLAGAFWEFLGIRLRRDADQQRLDGAAVESAPLAGDLLFFRRETLADAEARADAVSHVALCLGKGRFLHASGSAWGTAYNSLSPADSDYSPDLARRFIDARRYSPERSRP